MNEQPSAPEWIRVWNGGPYWDYLARFTDTDGRRHDWNIRFDNFDGDGRRSHMAWHAWPEIPDPDLWDRPVHLSGGIREAQDEFLIRIVHGWQPGFGYAEYNTNRPIYGKDGVRRERAFILAELTGRGVCPQCWRVVGVGPGGSTNGSFGVSVKADALHRHGPHKGRCPGSFGAPAKETVLEVLR